MGEALDSVVDGWNDFEAFLMSPAFVSRGLRERSSTFAANPARGIVAGQLGSREAGMQYGMQGPYEDARCRLDRAELVSYEPLSGTEAPNVRDFGEFRLGAS